MNLGNQRNLESNLDEFVGIDEVILQLSCLRDDQIGLLG